MMENSTITTINNNVIIAETTTDLITIDEMEKPDCSLKLTWHFFYYFFKTGKI